MQISALTIYPIKSCGSVALEAAELDDFGLRGDRRFMVAEADSGQFVTQRADPVLAMVGVDAAGPSSWSLTDGRGVLGPLILPRIIPGSAEVSVEVWGDVVRGVACGEAVDRWFSGVVGRPVRLVYMAAQTVRQVDLNYAAPGERVSFADGFSLLVANQGSLDDLNRRLASRGKPAVSMARFRPNLVVAGPAPWVEDRWRALRAGAVRLDVVKPCGRCVMTTVDSATGQSSGQEPLATLATFRRADDGNVIFGQNLMHRTRGSLRLGQRLQVTVV